MSSSFSFRRLRLLLRVNIAEQGKKHLLIVSLMLVLLLLMMLPVCMYDTYINYGQLSQYAAVPLLLFMGTSQYTGTTFANYSSGSKGMWYLMTPGSQVEKYLCAWIINMAFVIPFLALFWTLHDLTINLGNARIPADGIKYSLITRDAKIYISFCYLLLHSSVLHGSIYFSESSFIKTYVSLLGIVVAIIFLNSQFAKSLVTHPEPAGVFPFGGWSFFIKQWGIRAYSVNFPDSALPWLCLTPALLITGIWYAAYERLKEKQI